MDANNLKIIPATVRYQLRNSNKSKNTERNFNRNFSRGGHTLPDYAATERNQEESIRYNVNGSQYNHIGFGQLFGQFFQKNKTQKKKQEEKKLQNVIILWVDIIIHRLQDIVSAQTFSHKMLVFCADKLRILL